MARRMSKASRASKKGWRPGRGKSKLVGPASSRMSVTKRWSRSADASLSALKPGTRRTAWGSKYTEKRRNRADSRKGKYRKGSLL